MGPGIFDKFAQALHHRRTGKKFAEKFDLSTQFFRWKRLDEPLCGGCRVAVKLCRLRGGGPRDVQRFSFRGNLAHESNGEGFRRVNAASCEQKIAHDGVADVALEARNATEARD